jgi:large subunit ribosomal protein L9
VDKHLILLEKPFKELGIFTVPIKLHPEVTANLKVWIVKA